MKQEKYCIRIAQDIWKIKRSVLLGNIVYNILNILRSYIYLLFPAWILDILISSKNIHDIIRLVIIGVCLNGILYCITSWLENVNMENSDFCSMIEKNRITRKLMKMEYSLLEEKEYAKAIARLRSETKVRGGVFYNFLQLMNEWMTSTTKILVSGIVLWTFWPTLFIDTATGFEGSTWFVLILLAGMVVACICLTRIKEMVNRKARILQNEFSEIDQVYEIYRDEISRYQTGKEIRLFQMQPYILKEATRKMLKNGKRINHKIALNKAIGDSAGYVIFIVLSFGFYSIIGNRMLLGFLDIGDAVIYAGSLIQFLDGFRKAAACIGEVKDIESRAQMYYDVLDIQEQNLVTSKYTISNLNENLLFEFKGVCFKYQKEEVLKDINLTIQPGEKLAIVGENGSGKSTLIKLLCGLYEPQMGSILLNKYNIRQYDSQQYRELFAVIFQDFTLYAYSLGENIAVSCTYEKEQIEDRLRQVGFTSKYDLETIVYKDCNPDGVELSAGEAQKVALARAIYLDAPVIIMDEPTSAMDPFAEMKLYHQLDEISSGKTIVYISHRLSSCKFCDRIIVLDQGELVQCGTHDELVKDAKGKYFELWQAQAKYFENKKVRYCSFD